MAEGGVIGLDDLLLGLEAEGLKRPNLMKRIGTMTYSHGLIDLEEEAETVAATEDGFDHMAIYGQDLERAHEMIRRQQQFAAVDYRLLNFLEGRMEMRDKERKPGNVRAGKVWVFETPLNQPVSQYMSRALDIKQGTVIKMLDVYAQMGLVEVVKADDKLKHIVNIRLTKRGGKRLKTIRETYPEKIAELDASDTVQRMSQEINHMREQLREPVEDFEYLSSLDPQESLKKAEDLEATLERLERRLNRANAKRALPESERRRIAEEDVARLTHFLVLE
jgi:DNA-binding MarR family transcriptional regulator